MQVTALSMISSCPFLLMLNCFLGAASVRNTKRRSWDTQDSGFVQSPSDTFSGDPHQDMVSQHMSKLYEKYNRENRLREGNTVRSFRASQGVWIHRLTCMSCAWMFLLGNNTETRVGFCAIRALVIPIKKQRINDRSSRKAPLILSMDGY